MCQCFNRSTWSQKSYAVKPVAMPLLVPSPNPNVMPDRVLVVDETGPVREVIVRFLRKAGFETVEACTAEEAIWILHNLEQPLVAVLSGVEMHAVSVMRLVEVARAQNPRVAI
jgi:CheY-like chemotaxis protein